MDKLLRNRDGSQPPLRQGRPPASAPKNQPTPVPFAEETRTDPTDKSPIHIGLRPMTCCGRWEVPQIAAWRPDGNASVICPGCGKRGVFTPAMLRMIQ